MRSSRWGEMGLPSEGFEMRTRDRLPGRLQGLRVSDRFEHHSPAMGLTAVNAKALLEKK